MSYIIEGDDIKKENVLLCYKKFLKDNSILTVIITLGK
jgi:hypothetical protein